MDASEGHSVSLDADYCTLWPEGEWADCCKAHDEGYALLLEMQDLALVAEYKARLDIELGQCVAATGTQNHDMALLMIIGTLFLGWLAMAKAKLKSWLR